jgi:hypothetical protein
MSLPPWQIKIIKQRAIVRFYNKIEIYDCETFSTVFKTIEYGGDICIIDEFFILSRIKAFEVYNLDGNLVANVEEAFEGIACFKFHGLDICNKKLILTTSFNQLIEIDMN